VEAFVGIEIDQRAVKAARRNAANRGRGNGEFVSGDVAELLPEWLGRFSAAATAVVIDPPRAGCSTSILELLRRAHPGQIIYISCHPATLARDLNVLRRDGVYELLKVVPLDMFPQTQHIECVADLRARPTP
jgi:23S rRNA (uracil1939-C5)-methyltransferase